ncbi:MAG: DUF58 domain-containing protein [Eubacteriales bacterium]
MIYIAVIISVIIVLVLQARIYKKHAYDRLEYKVSVSTNEVFEGEEIYIYEEITNKKLLPLPFLKVDTELPDGLSFRIVERDEKTGALKETFPRIIHSIFMLRGNQMIKRRWRVKCGTRGTYHLGAVTMIADDIFGTYQNAKVIEPDKSSKAVVTVLPKAINLSSEFTSSEYTNGEFIVENSLLSDPLLKAGIREYVNGDPMNRINWKQTAVHNKLMVNIEEFTNRHQFNIILNIQSRDIEKTIPGPPSSRAPVELCLTVAASILDKVSSENVPVRIISNTPPENICGDEAKCADGDVLSNLYISPAFRGKNDMLDALRILAQLELMISTPVEKMMDCIVENPYVFTSGGNIIFVSAYLSERMINFCYSLRQYGVNCIFYITSASINASIIPDDIEVHFKTYIETT